MENQTEKKLSSGLTGLQIGLLGCVLATTVAFICWNFWSESQASKRAQNIFDDVKRQSQEDADTRGMRSQFDVISDSYVHFKNMGWYTPAETRQTDDLLPLMAALNDKWWSQYHGATEVDKKVLLTDRKAKQSEILNKYVQGPDQVRLVTEMLRGLVDAK